VDDRQDVVETSVEARFEANADLYAARRKFYQVKGMNLSLISRILHM